MERLVQRRWRPKVARISIDGERLPIVIGELAVPNKWIGAGVSELVLASSLGLRLCKRSFTTPSGTRQLPSFSCDFIVRQLFLEVRERKFYEQLWEGPSKR